MTEPTSSAPPKPRRYVPAVGPRLEKLLWVVFALFALLAVNSVYLLGIRFLEAVTEKTYQNWFSILMLLGHLVLGFLILAPVVVFGILHLKNARHRPNRRAVKVGYALFTTSLVLLITGVVLTRIEGVIVVKDPAVRGIAWWLHVLTPLVAAWLFVLHRLAGKRINWKLGRRWAVAAVAIAGALLAFHSQDPRQWNVQGPKSGEQYFFPSLARTSTGNFIPEKVIVNDAYCQECHGDVHERWSNSAHKFSSFNNPPYLFSVRETRKVSLERDGDLRAARWCAGCHDPAVFFTGKFDDPDFDDVNDPTAKAGITCTTCHSITHVNSTRGNSDYTIEEPEHYPFAFSESESLQWVNRQLVKAKPELHKKTFLKPFHRTAEFCSSCHKVHLPPELNKYKWLRGQNHYDAYLLSGVSGHGVTSFYYPPKATHNCVNACHMPLLPSDDFGARDFDGQGGLEVHDHLFPGANTGIPHLLDLPEWVNEAHRDFNDGVMRVDLFGIKAGGTIDGELHAPLRPEIPILEPGQSYLVEVVVRTLKMGHLFTQGTADSNEIWLDVTARVGDRVIGRSGGLGPDNAVDPWSHFVNVYMLDRHGKRIDRRNAQDIFVPLYNHQIPPGAADVIHYRVEIPPDVTGPVTLDARLQYRKFDTTYLKHVYGDEYENDLPILTLATDRVDLPVAGGPVVAAEAVEIPEWQRWNDYGIGLLRKGGTSKGELRGAEQAFTRVEELGRPDGPLNLARVYLAQGTVQDKAVAALERAARFDPPAPGWSVAWFTGLVNKQNGYLDEAIAAFRSIVDANTPEIRQRELDFGQDYRLLGELGQTLFERAKQERGPARREAREALLREAADVFQRGLAIDSEDASSHYNLTLIYGQLGDKELAAKHRALHQKYKTDDNARDRAVAIARSNDPAADHAAEAIVIYDLQRDGAYESEAIERQADRFELPVPSAAPADLPVAPVAGG
jgi:tetratricopeptide (TPR) repeat protein